MCQRGIGGEHRQRIRCGISGESHKPYGEEVKMKVMYIDCGMGAAGDMLTAALLELIPDREDFVRKLNGIWRDGVETVAKSEKRCGIRGTLVDVLVDGRA
ncbi:MAG TPA: hypothetical protein DIS68_07810, partial [Lachnospiraceae bacterium]|nr:hypothetical protein [Lachnospiraceae bacterium]